MTELSKTSMESLPSDRSDGKREWHRPKPVSGLAAVAGNPMQGGISAWYCARTKPKHEHIAAANVVKRLGLEVFHPRLRMERATRRGLVRVVEPLFPCYVFVRCNLENYFDGIRHVTGISSLVHFGAKIPAVPDAAIEELRQCFESEEPMVVADGVVPGAEVQIVEGVFMGFSGMAVRTLSAGQRVQILLDFLGRITLAEVDRKSLRVENRRVADLVPLLATASASGPA
jgi:transcriptional antiterminator RfaH